MYLFFLDMDVMDYIVLVVLWVMSEDNVVFDGLGWDGFLVVGYGVGVCYLGSVVVVCLVGYLDCGWEGFYLIEVFVLVFI